MVQALTGEDAGCVIEPRKMGNVWRADLLGIWGRQHRTGRKDKEPSGLCAVGERGMQGSGNPRTGKERGLVLARTFRKALLIRRRISPRVNVFPCPSTSEGLYTLSPAVLRKGIDTHRSAPSRYEVCEMSGLGICRNWSRNS